MAAVFPAGPISSVIFWGKLVSESKKLTIAMREPIVRTQYRIIYGDTDAGSVVYNANYLRLFEIGRGELMRQHVLAYSEIEKMDLILPVIESYLRFKAPAKYDDLVSIDTCIAEIGPFTSRFNYKIFKPLENDREQLLVKGFTVHACVDRKGKLAQFPQNLQEKMEKLHHST